MIATTNLLLRSSYYIIPSIFVFYALRKIRELSWVYCTNNVKLTNKFVIVTGANSGIGYHIAKQLAARDAFVIMACRNIEKGRKAAENIKKELEKKLKSNNINDIKLIVMHLDLASLKSIKKFADEIHYKFPKIDILINNAGVSYPSKKPKKTIDGFEIHFGVNYIGHYYLTKLLFHTLIMGRPSRIVNVTSSLHEKGEISLGMPVMAVASPQKHKKHYANSKLAVVYFTQQLNLLYSQKGVYSYAVCPGWVYTNLFRHYLRWYHYLLVWPIAFLFMRTPKQGAQTVIYCATEPHLEAQSGLIFKDCKEYQSKKPLDDAFSHHLWLRTDEWIKDKGF